MITMNVPLYHNEGVYFINGRIECSCGRKVDFYDCGAYWLDELPTRSRTCECGKVWILSLELRAVYEHVVVDEILSEPVSFYEIPVENKNPSRFVTV